MLVKPTVAELLEKSENRYRLVVATAKRARQISNGSKPMVSSKDISSVSLAADEIEEDELKIYNEEEWKELQNSLKEQKETDEVDNNVEIDIEKVEENQ